MSRPLDFHPEAYPDVQQAHRWYDRQRQGLGRNFLEAAEETVAEIAANPQRYGILEGDVRAAPVGRLPYLIYYQVFPDRVRIMGVLHAARDPAVWQGRI